jgi:hypothetical protein
MKVISFIERCRPGLAEKILRHCGLLNDVPLRPSPLKFADFEESLVDEETRQQEPLAVYDEFRQEEPPAMFKEALPDDGFF